MRAMREIRNAAKWNANIEDVCDYLKSHKCDILEIPADALGRTGVKLRRWLEDMKRAYFGQGNLRLTPEQRDDLKKLGIEKLLSPNERVWLSHLQELHDFYLLHGHFNIPENFACADGKLLSKWLKSQKMRFKQGKLKPQYVQKFEESGLMAALESPLETGLRHAKLYFQEHENLDVRTDFISDDGYRLGVWIKTMRERAKAGELAENVRSQLDEMGMIWDKTGHDWEQMFGKCMAFYTEHGHLQDRALQNWLTRNRKKLREGELSPKQVELFSQLEALKKAVPESTRRTERLREKWLAIFAECEGFYKKYGDLEFPANFRGKTDVDLRDWLSRNRQKFHTGELPEEFVEKLKRIGAFEKHTDWKQCFDACKRFFKKHGNLEFPDDFCCNDGINLKAWLQLNQERAAADMLPDRRKRQLASIGAWVDETHKFVISMSDAQKEELLENAKASGFSDANAYLRSLLGLEESGR